MTKHQDKTHTYKFYDQNPLLSTEDTIISIFIQVDDKLGKRIKAPRCSLHDSEIITIGILYVLSGQKFRAFHRKLYRNYRHLFPNLPTRRVLHELLKDRQNLCDDFLADASLFSVVDSYPIELIFPKRQGRSKEQVGKKGKDKGRWFVGIRLAWIVNDQGQVVSWAWHTANKHDQNFHPLIQDLKDASIVLGDLGFRKAAGIPDNLKLCERGQWNSRMIVETIFSMITNTCSAKKFSERSADAITTKLAFLAAMFNVLLDVHKQVYPDAPVELSLAHFSF